MCTYIGRKRFAVLPIFRHACLCPHVFGVLVFREIHFLPSFGYFVTRFLLLLEGNEIQQLVHLPLVVVALLLPRASTSTSSSHSKEQSSIQNAASVLFE